MKKYRFAVIVSALQLALGAGVATLDYLSNQAIGYDKLIIIWAVPLFYIMVLNGLLVLPSGAHYLFRYRKESSSLTTMVAFAIVLSIIILTVASRLN